MTNQSGNHYHAIIINYTGYTIPVESWLLDVLQVIMNNENGCQYHVILNFQVNVSVGPY